MNCYFIMGLRVDHRTGNAVALQSALTEFGCNIRLRVGLDETDEAYCSDDGVILLQVCGNEETVREMLSAFNGLEGVNAQMMNLN